MKKDQVTLTIPHLSFQETLMNFKHLLLSVIDNLKLRFSQYRNNQSSSSFNRTDYSPRKNLKSYLPLLVLGFFVILVIGLVVGSSYYILKALPKKTSAVSIAGARANQNLNKEFSFPLKDASGKEVSKIKFVIQNAEIRDELIIQGQKALSVQGRTFLVLNLKITNDQNQDVKINTRDYMRLSVNGSNDWIAPEVHNDPVDVQPISTKFTRVAFAVNTTDKNLKLRVGEINGTKEDIKLTLQ